MASIVEVTVCPSFRKTGGTIPKPTPAGVPVKMRSPGSRVMIWLRYATSSTGLNKRSEVRELCA